MLLEQTIDKLIAMRLKSMAHSLKTRLAKPDHAGLAFSDLFGLIVDDEWTSRQNRRLQRRLQSANFKDKAACVENIDYRTQRGLRKSVILELAQNHWIDQHQNLVLTGKTGSGKSYLTQALAQQACRAGYSVFYARLPKFLPELAARRADGTYLKTLKQLSKTQLLALDDWGIPTIGTQERCDLLEIVEDRLGIGATIVASQLPVAAWHSYLGAGIIADAICDRLVKCSFRIELTSEESMRGTELTTNPATL